MYFTGETLDDVMRGVLRALLRPRRIRVTASRGDTAEILGALVRIRDPRGRLSRTEKKGLPFGCLGELIWYLAESDKLSFIKHYLPKYSKDAEPNGTLHGAYGPRMVGQLKNVIKLLQDRNSTRRAVVQIFDKKDLRKHYKEIPCTTTLQFFIRKKRLHMFTSMRSNDAFWGLPNDVFAFTMIQEIVARSLDVELGEYTHAVGSLHLYDRIDDKDVRRDAQQFLEEGWQQSKPMPAMPFGDPWPAVSTVVKAEPGIRRTGKPTKAVSLAQLDPYWMDLLRLLQVHWHGRLHRADEIKSLKKQMASKIYDPYIDHRLVRATTARSKPRQTELFPELN